MTLLDDPPTISEPSAAAPPIHPGRPGAWRFAVRLARRETRRRPGRTVLAALLVAAPVFAMTLGSVMVRTDRDDWATQFERDYAGIDVVANPSAVAFATDDEVRMSAVDVPAGTIVDDYLWITTSVTSADVVEPMWTVFTDIDLVGDGDGQPIEIVEGRAPQGGELLLDADTADQLGVEIGDTVEFERPLGNATLVGIGQLRGSYWERVVNMPGFDRDRITADALLVTTTYQFPDGTSDDEIRQFAGSVGGVSSLDDPFWQDTGVGETIAWGWVGGVLALVAVGIIVAAAFATSARRQLVTIGQLSANGATSTVVRRTLALQGTWTGLIGGVVGMVAGLVALPFVRPWAERVLQRDLPSYVIGWFDLVIVLVTATVAATVAAAVPARSAARIPVMAALAGRRPLGRLPRWLVPTGLALTGGGLGLMTLSTLAARNSASVDIFTLLTVIGVVGVVFGMCCSTPIVVERVGGLGRRASLSWRLALRGLVRSRTRSSAVVAAIAVAVGGAVAAAAVVETTTAEHRSGWRPIVPADMVVLQRWDSYPQIEEADQGALLDLATPTDVAVPLDVRDQVMAVTDGGVFTPIRTATFDPAPFDPAMTDPFWRSGRGPFVADAALIRAVGMHPDDVSTLQREGSLRPWLSNDEVYVTDEFGIGVVQLGPGEQVPAIVYDAESGPISVPAPVAEHPLAYDNWLYGTIIITEAAAREFGFGLAESGGIVQFDADLTAADRTELLDVMFALRGQFSDAFVEPGDPPRDALAPEGEWGLTYDDPTWRDQRADDVWIARAIVVGAALLLSLLVVAIGLSLAAAEGRDERNTLTVVGAMPASMRRQASARAVVLAGSGIVLGIPTGFVPAWVLYRIANHGDESGNALGLPWLVIGALVVAVPLLIGSAAFIAAGVGQRFRPPTPTRRD